MFGLIGSALSAAGSWIGGAVSGITGAVSSLVSNPAVQKAAGAAISTFVPKSAPSKPKPVNSVPKIRSEREGSKDNTMLYIALGGIALIAIVFLMKR